MTACSPPWSTKTRRTIAVVGLSCWTVVVGTGMCLVNSYMNQPGAIASPPDSLPQYATMSPHKYRLLMFAHPHCPCTAASLSELARLLTCCNNKVEATVYFYRPEKEPDSWASGQLWRSATAIPGVNVQIDPSGEMAVRFGSKTSGNLMLYDSSGRIRFHGGITPGRGHEGDSLGKSAIVSIVTGDLVNVDQSPVFGCALRAASE